MSFIEIKGQRKVPVLMFLGGFLAIPFAAILNVITSGWISECFLYLMIASIAVTLVGLVAATWRAETRRRPRP